MSFNIGDPRQGGLCGPRVFVSAHCEPEGARRPDCTRPSWPLSFRAPLTTSALQFGNVDCAATAQHHTGFQLCTHQPLHHTRPPPPDSRHRQLVRSHPTSPHRGFSSNTLCHCFVPPPLHLASATTHSASAFFSCKLPLTQQRYSTSDRELLAIYLSVCPPLTTPYDDPFRVIRRSDRYYKLGINGSSCVLSIDRLKPAHLDKVDVSSLSDERSPFPQDTSLLLHAQPSRRKIHFTTLFTTFFRSTTPDLAFAELFSFVSFLKRGGGGGGGYCSEPKPYSGDSIQLLSLLVRHSTYTLLCMFT